LRPRNIEQKGKAAAFERGAGDGDGGGDGELALAPPANEAHHKREDAEANGGVVAVAGQAVE